MPTFQSNVKSVVSVDEDSCERDACVELRQKYSLLAGRREGEDTDMIRMELTYELERCRRKLSLL